MQKQCSTTHRSFDRSALQRGIQYEGKRIHVCVNQAYTECRVTGLGRHFTALLSSIDISSSCLILTSIEKAGKQQSPERISDITLPLSCVEDISVGRTWASEVGPLHDIRRYILSQKLLTSLDASVASSLRVALALPVLRAVCEEEQIEDRIKGLTIAPQTDAVGVEVDASWWQRCASEFMDTLEQAMLQCTNRFFNANVILCGSGSDRLLLLKVASLLHSEHGSINHMFRDISVDPDPHPAVIYITPLHLGARAGNLALCSLLLAEKADVNATLQIAEKPEIDDPAMEEYNGVKERLFLENWQNLGTASLGRDMHGSCLQACYTYHYDDVTPLKLALTFKHDKVVALLRANCEEICEPDGNDDCAIFFDATYKQCAERRVYKNLMYRSDPLKKVRVGSYNCGFVTI
jgi:hypothetical protein